MRYLSVCSGIEAASVAWEPLGWEPVAFSEIEPFPSAVLARRFPNVPNLGNMLDYEKWNIDSIDVLVGGTPCQSFSVAGKRGGLNDDRGNLCLTFCEIADRFNPEWVLWENVPGVFTSCDDDKKPKSERVYAFGCLLGELCGAGRALHPDEFGGRLPDCGVVSGEKRTVAWRVLDAQWIGVPQRRKRVFVLASRGAGNFRCADALLPVGESLPRYFEAGRKKGKEAACRAGRGFEKSHWDGGPHPTLDARGTGVGASDQEIFAQRGAYLVPDVSPAVTSKWAKGTGGPSGDETQNLVVELFENHAQDSRVKGPLNVCPSVTAKWGTGGGNTPILFHLQQDPISSSEGDPCYKLTSGGRIPVINYGNKVVRRLTPRECERLQGFPDDWTLVPFGKVVRPEKMDRDYARYLMRGGTVTFEECCAAASDGVRYKAIGNSMATVVMAWIGRQMEKVGERERRAC